MNPGFAPAKVNLWLHVGRRRKDGYHELASLIAFALDAGDEVKAAPAEELTLEIMGPEAAALGDPGDAVFSGNLVMKAAHALAAAAHKERHGARLSLCKALPVASGVGGGSADAAAALRLLNAVWELDWPLERLAHVGEAVGADVPVCVWSKPAAVEGKGEQVDPMSAWPELNAVLVNPRVPVSTVAVFERFDAGAAETPRRMELPLGVRRQEEAITLIREGANDLEPAARAIAPQIGDALDALEGEGNCLVSRMSGSGATCFGLYETPQAAARAAARISQARPDWWVAATRLGGCAED